MSDTSQTKKGVLIGSFKSAFINSSIILVGILKTSLEPTAPDGLDLSTETLSTTLVTTITTISAENSTENLNADETASVRLTTKASDVETTIPDNSPQHTIGCRND